MNISPLKIKFWLMSGKIIETEFNDKEFVAFLKQWDNTLWESPGYNPIRYLGKGIHLNLKSIEVIEKVQDV